MHKRIATGLMSLVLILSACKSDKDTTTSVEFGNLPEALIDSLKTIGQPVQQFEIDPLKNNVVRGKNGTVLFIAANSLIDHAGAPVHSGVVIELKEHYTFADFITSNLQTVHHNDILQTQGMIYFDVHTKDGNVVKIDPAKPIRIEFPLEEKVTAAKIFKGHRDNNGDMNWDEIIEPEKLLVPFPVASLFQNRSECEAIFFLRTDLSFDGDSVMVIQDNYDTKYENTLIATREFRQRFITNCSPVISKIYMDNLDKNLWEIDEIVVQHYIEDSVGLTNLLPGQARAQEFNKDHALEHDRKMILAFKKFAEEKLTRIDPTKKVSDSVIRAATRDAIVADSTRFAQRAAAQQRDYDEYMREYRMLSTLHTAYAASEFGWVNVDYFYNDPTAKKIKLSATTNVPSVFVTLIIPGRKVVISALSDDKKTHQFTKTEDGYNMLPAGEKAIIVCIAMNGNKILFAAKTIVIGEQEIEKIELISQTTAAIKQQLENLEK
jgi:hypothetical protein